MSNQRGSIAKQPVNYHGLVLKLYRRWRAMRKSKAKKSLCFLSDLPTDLGSSDHVESHPVFSEEQKSSTSLPSSTQETSGIDVKIEDLWFVNFFYLSSPEWAPRAISRFLLSLV
jgi:hypothetical protein